MRNQIEEILRRQYGDDSYDYFTDPQAEKRESIATTEIIDVIVKEIESIRTSHLDGTQSLEERYAVNTALTDLKEQLTK